MKIKIIICEFYKTLKQNLQKGFKAGVTKWDLLIFIWMIYYLNLFYNNFVYLEIFFYIFFKLLLELWV